jgi:acetylglutamate kinase
VQRKIVSGGMVLKLEAAKRALEGGVRGVHIVGGTSPNGLLAAVRAAQADTPVFSDEVPGTRVVREPIVADVRMAHSAA